MVRDRSLLILFAFSTALAGAGPALAAPTAAAVCPPQGFADAVNRAANPSFETVGLFGPLSVCPAPCHIEKDSAAQSWRMHSDNAGSAITTILQTPSLVPFGTDPPKGSVMLRVVAGGAEGGVFQPQAPPRTGRVMVSVWVYVVRGRAVLTMNSMTNLGPAAWSTKIRQWEQLRVCNAPGVPIDRITVATPQPAPGGGEFFVDRVEVRQVPTSSP